MSKKNKKNKRQGESDLDSLRARRPLFSEVIPRYLRRDVLSQIIRPVDRVIKIGRIQSGLAFRQSRLPYKVFRSQPKVLGERLKKSEVVFKSPITRSYREDRLLYVPGKKNVCQSRYGRRSALFALRVAGRGRRRSPGRGGTYRRKEESLQSCRS